jgi:hypothetical protein
MHISSTRTLLGHVWSLRSMLVTVNTIKDNQHIYWTHSAYGLPPVPIALILIDDWRFEVRLVLLLFLRQNVKTSANMMARPQVQPIKAPPSAVVSSPVSQK